jgi:hypothetical protein
MVLFQKRAALYWFSLGWMRGGPYDVIPFNMREKQLVFYSVTAVIIPMIELARNFDKIPKTGAAFPTPGTFECNHSLKRGFGSEGDKSIPECDSGHISKEEFISRQ